MTKTEFNALENKTIGLDKGARLTNLKSEINLDLTFGYILLFRYYCNFVLRLFSSTL